MGHQVTIGGDRLGSGKKMKADLHGYDRSTHNIGYVWKSTMAAGTLVPFMAELALPGDTFDINLNCDVLTHPTIGPLFGSYKIQLDVFQTPIRLYQGKLHMNMLGIGMDMSKVPLPQIALSAHGITDRDKPIDNQQTNPSSIFSYLGIRGIGLDPLLTDGEISRQFSALTYLIYWDKYKQYYANKQEEEGWVIHKDVNVAAPVIVNNELSNSIDNQTITFGITTPGNVAFTMYEDTTLTIETSGITNSTTADQFVISIWRDETGTGAWDDYYLDDMFETIDFNTNTGVVIGITPTELFLDAQLNFRHLTAVASDIPDTDREPQITKFALENIDTMRQNLLSHFTDVPYQIDQSSLTPYSLPFQKRTGEYVWSHQYSQEGLALKTYNSDLFNNWIQTEWIDGTNGIAEATAVDTSTGSFTIDELNLSKKIYDMLNRIAVSGGTYDDWMSAVYDETRTRSVENPMYIGGLIQNLVFEEVVSNAASQDQPLGTLAGRGRVGSKRKGGEIIAKVSEPSYITGIVSLTPNLDYSQGNKWDMNLKTMNDLHKPALDEIGFQDLITDQMAWWDTQIVDGEPLFRSAGKQPAWINYMTNVNQVRGNFADQTQQMFMVLNRRYGLTYEMGIPKIADVTTYIDPTKFNHIFADTRRDAQNFWCQIAVNITARRKMSAKLIPNL